jgi:hypothetical protein
MRNLLYTALLALVVGAGATAGFYFSHRDPELSRAARAQDALAWLRLEFHLTPVQEAAITKLQNEYAVVCTDHCLAIAAARKRTAPAAEITALEKTCTDAMRKHFTDVAALMSPGEGRRYLDEVLPRIDSYNHAASPNVGGMN